MLVVKICMICCSSTPLQSHGFSVAHSPDSLKSSNPHRFAPCKWMLQTRMSDTIRIPVRPIIPQSLELNVRREAGSSGMCVSFFRQGPRMAATGFPSYEYPPQIICNFSLSFYPASIEPAKASS